MATLLLSNDFTDDADTPAVSAGLELGSTDLFDVAGDQFSIADGELSAVNGDPDTLSGKRLVCHADLTASVVDQEAVVRFIKPADPYDVIVCLRVQVSGHHYQFFIFGSSWLFWKRAATEPQLDTGAFDSPLILDRAYEFHASIVGATLTIRLKDLVTDAFLPSGAHGTTITYTDGSSPILAAGQMGLNAFRTSRITHLDLYDLFIPDASMTADPDTLTAGGLIRGSRSNLVRLTGTDTAWGIGSTPFLLSGGTDAEIVYQKVLAAGDAILRIDAGSEDGTLTISETGSSAEAEIAVNPNAATNRIVGVGDSLMALAGVDEEEFGMMAAALAILGPSWTAARFGAPGATVTPSASQIPWGSIPSPLAGRNILLIEGGLNDFAGDVTPQQVYDYMLSRLDDFPDYEPWAMTLAPYGGVAGDLNPDIATFNGLLRADWVTDSGGVLIDLADFAGFADPALSPLASDYMDPDKIHYAAPTYALLGQLMAAMIMNGGSSSGGGSGGSSGGGPRGVILGAGISIG
jgi:hypothetical protein